MYIIADIGSNFHTLEQAYKSIEKAAEAGAHMAKFQLFSEFDLYGEGSTERKIEQWLPLLKYCCDANEVEFGCTAFSPAAHRIVDPFVNDYKVASSCVTHIPLLKAIEASKSTTWGCTKKHVILSVGGCTEEEIRAALKIFKTRKKTIMYCQAAYPSRMFDLGKLKLLQKKFPYHTIGYSDHTTDILGAPLAASRLARVTVLEKHFTAFPDLNTPDRHHSLTPAEFRLMVDAMRNMFNGVPEALGPSPEEADFVKFDKVRLTDKGYTRVRKC